MLNKCPLCGSLPVDHYTYVKCPSCGLTSPWADSGPRNDDLTDHIDHQQAIERWNTLCDYLIYAKKGVMK